MNGKDNSWSRVLREENTMREKRSDLASDLKAMDRRHFFRALGGASTVAAAALSTPLMATDAEAYDPGEEETRSRYQANSPDVQAFYRTNAYETLKKK